MAQPPKSSNLYGNDGNLFVRVTDNSDDSALTMMKPLKWQAVAKSIGIPRIVKLFLVPFKTKRSYGGALKIGCLSMSSMRVNYGTTVYGTVRWC